MVEEIRQIEALSEEEKQRLFGWGEDIFGVTALDLSWRSKGLHFLFYADRELVSHVSVLKHEVSVEGEPVVVGGVGGVVTVPTAQKKGYARKLMRHAAELFERDWQVDAGLLFCLPKMTSYYQALGWRKVEGPVLIEQPAGKIVAPLEVMVLPLGGKEWPSGSVELRSLPW